MKKTVLITGGNKGIGLEVTREFINLNYNIIVVAIAFDLTRIDDIPELVSTLGSIDVLVNNAGVMFALAYNNYPNDKIQTMLKLNLESPVKLIEEVSKSMPKEGSGRIVNNASIAGQIGHPDIWYGITKAGMINATKSFSKIFDGKIVINAVAATNEI